MLIVPTAQQNDNSSLSASDVKKVNTHASGPKRDLIGELSVAVRQQGLKQLAKDLAAPTDKGTFDTGYTASVPRNDVAVIRLFPPDVNSHTFP